MRKEDKKITALVPAVGAAREQLSNNKSKEIVTENGEKNNLQNQQGKDMTGLQAVSMYELYENVYPPKLPVIEGLLNSGTYLFVGAPKVGKSFFMAQIAYHISMGLPLWNYQVR